LVFIVKTLMHQENQFCDSARSTVFFFDRRVIYLNLEDLSEWQKVKLGSTYLNR